MNDHASNLERVSARIGRYVEAFFDERLKLGGAFHAKDLVDYVQEKIVGIAPDSPGRIMRQLKREGRIDYEVESRADSRYRALPVRGQIEMRLR